MGILIDERLNSLLLIAGEIEMTESPRPTALHPIGAGGVGMAVGVHLVALVLLLGESPEGRRKHSDKGASGPEVHFHAPNRSFCAAETLERRIRT